MQSVIAEMAACLSSIGPDNARVVAWGCPVPVFGKIQASTVATLGLNPSVLEFQDADGRELNGNRRRFPTLASLGITSWADATETHLSQVERSCAEYFANNPYDAWFRQLDRLISASGYSYYSDGACHLDVVPFATSCNWGGLSTAERRFLVQRGAMYFARMLDSSAVKLLVLNGAGVIGEFERMAGVSLPRRQMKSWTLPRQNGEGVPGYSVVGDVDTIGSISLGRKIRVIGFNHNIQSSFGVTSRVRQSIRKWITAQSRTLHAAV